MWSSRRDQTGKSATRGTAILYPHPHAASIQYNTTQCDIIQRCPIELPAGYQPCDELSTMTGPLPHLVLHEGNKRAHHHRHRASVPRMFGHCYKLQTGNAGPIEPMEPMSKRIASCASLSTSSLISTIPYQTKEGSTYTTYQPWKEVLQHHQCQPRKKALPCVSSIPSIATNEGSSTI